MLRKFASHVASMTTYIRQTLEVHTTVWAADEEIP
jgi:hypothetical protein